MILSVSFFKIAVFIKQCTLAKKETIGKELFPFIILNIYKLKFIHKHEIVMFQIEKSTF